MGRPNRALKRSSLSLTLKEASEAATLLSRCFRDVVIHAFQAPIWIHAGDHNRMPRGLRRCKHERVRVARHVFAGMYYDKNSGERFLALATSRLPGRRFASVATCLRCDAVTEATEE